jgi:hypothetical protein
VWWVKYVDTMRPRRVRCLDGHPPWSIIVPISIEKEKKQSGDNRYGLWVVNMIGISWLPFQDLIYIYIITAFSRSFGSSSSKVRSHFYFLGPVAVLGHVLRAQVNGQGR